ncbi:hypothetical protein NL676_025042 [Syzygium grande]|nr:hypothetical protein NL676_025042 [Syzygium grande]
MAMHQNICRWTKPEKNTNSKDSHSLKSWRPLDKGTLKWNIDGSYTPGSTEGSIAGICCDFSGKIVDGFITMVSTSSALNVETLACLETLKLLHARREEDKMRIYRRNLNSLSFAWDVYAAFLRV